MFNRKFDVQNFVMKKNIGNFDRLIRILAAAFLVILIFSVPIQGGLAIFLSVLGGLFFLTGVAGNCPLYSLLGINTCKAKHVKGSH